MTIHIASYDSRHYGFIAYGSTKDIALHTLLKVLRKHGKQNLCEANWWLKSDYGDEEKDTDEFIQNDVQFQVVELGQGYRDGYCLTKGEK